MSVERDAKETREKKKAARDLEDEGQPPNPKSLNYALLSQRKNMIGYAGALSDNQMFRGLFFFSRVSFASRSTDHAKEGLLVV